MCLGRPDEFVELAREMKSQNSFPDYITIDGAEGGTGAAPKSFMDDIGVPLYTAIPIVHKILQVRTLFLKYLYSCLYAL